MKKRKCTFITSKGIETFESITQAGRKFGIGRLALLRYISNGGIFYDKDIHIVKFVKFED